MVFDSHQGKAVRRRTIPSPMAMSFSGSLTYDEILRSGQQAFFPDFEDESLELFCLRLFVVILQELRNFYMFV